MKLLAGLQESAKLNEPIFTPSTKAETGPDVNITFKELQTLVGARLAVKLQRYHQHIPEGI